MYIISISLFIPSMNILPLLVLLQAFNQEVTAKQPECDHVLAEGQNLLQLAHPRAVPLLQSKLQQLERAWVDLRGKVGESVYFSCIFLSSQPSGTNSENRAVGIHTRAQIIMLIPLHMYVCMSLVVPCVQGLAVRLWPVTHKY